MPSNEMKNAPTEFPDVRTAEFKTIRVHKKAEASLVGSCNACVDRTPKLVTEVHLRGMSFRLCPTCQGILKRAL